MRSVKCCIALCVLQEMVSASGAHGTTSSQLCFWDLTTMTCRKVINDHDSNIVSLAYSRDDR